MNLITNIGALASQTFVLTLADGTQASVVLSYRPQQTGWYFDLTWNGVTPPFSITGRRLVTGPNILRHFKNKLTFGLAVITQNNVEPLNQNDFVDGVAAMYVLDQAEVGQVEMVAFPGNA